MSLTFKISFIKRLSRLLEVLPVIVFLNPVMPRQVYAQEVDQEILCQQFPFNRCKGYTPSMQRLGTKPEQQANPRENKASQIIKVRLGVSGPNNEWILIETSDNVQGQTIFRAYHTTRVKQNLLSGVVTNVLSFGAGQLASEVIDGYNGPAPVPDINFYRWADHKTRRLVFVPDSCSRNSPAPLENGQLSAQSTCAITGTESITLPTGTDIYAGLLTIEYTEENLIRTITFRVPTQR